MDKIGACKCRLAMHLVCMSNIEITVDSVELDGLYYRVEANIEYEWENDGIGSYEYWGSKGFDKGHDYAVPESVGIEAYLLLEDGESEVQDPILLRRLEDAISSAIDTALENVEPDDGPPEDYD